MKKSTRKKAPAVSTLAAKKKPVVGNVARRARQPARAKDSQGKVVESCPEFTLYANGRVESSPKVARAMMRSLLGVNSRAGDEDRIALAVALQDLMEHRAGQFLGDWEDLLDRLSESLGEVLLRAFNDGTKTRPTSAQAAVRRGIERISSAVTQLDRFRTRLPEPGDRSPGAWTWAIQLAAKDIFRESRRPPQEWEIWARLESEGWEVGSHKGDDDRREKLRAAGLESLSR